MRSEPPKDGNGVITPHDHPGISDDDFVIRRTDPKDLTDPDAQGHRRIKSWAFSQSSDRTGMSVDIESWLVEDGLAPTHYITDPKQGAKRISVWQLRVMGFQVGWCPETDNPHHGAVWGVTSSSHRRHVAAIAMDLRAAEGET